MFDKDPGDPESVKGHKARDYIGQTHKSGKERREMKYDGPHTQIA